MAKVVFIYDDMGIARFERRPTPWRDSAATGKKAFDIARNAEGALSAPDFAREYAQLTSHIVEAENSDHLSDAQKAEFRRLLVHYDVLSDSIEVERLPGSSGRGGFPHVTDPGPAGPTDDMIVGGEFDP